MCADRNYEDYEETREPCIKDPGLSVASYKTNTDSLFPRKTSDLIITSGPGCECVCLLSLYVVSQMSWSLVIFLSVGKGSWFAVKSDLVDGKLCLHTG